jgi:SNF2 family DNA or RNA helicase
MNSSDLPGWTEIDWHAHLFSGFVSQIDSWTVPAANETPVVSARFRKRPVKVQSYFFVENEFEKNAPQTPVGGQRAATPAADGSTTAENPTPASKMPTRTRLQPPGDVIKLSDRLFYVLQPPLEHLFAGNTMEFPFKPFNFQYAGVAFLFPRHSAILADEMGLGKTMQAITSMRMLLRTGHAKSILLISPKPLVTNWLREFALWAPEIPVAAIQGNQAQRQWHWTCDRAPVKIANYELMTRDEPILKQFNLSYDLIVLDEAQRIKNRSNATSKTIRDIPRSRSWALTGTPIENGLEDLVGICEFVSPGTLNVNMTPREARREVKDMILRRTKDIVMKDMPPRLMRDAELDLSAEQVETYHQAENDGVLRLNEMGHEISIKHVFELVLRLKQICNFDPATGQSSKMERLKADMEEVAASGQKAIVFSQWVDTIGQISPHLSEFRPLEFHGRIPSKQRDLILEEFKLNPQRNVLLMSYGAGSVGLNLQFCRYVFLFDRWWNPAVEDQAINRAHRIGAAGSVTVTRMISIDTIEQRIHDILEAKRELFREVLSNNEKPSRRGLSKEEIFGLFNLRTPEGMIRKVA